MNIEKAIHTLSSIRPFVLGEDPEVRKKLQSIDSFLKKEILAFADQPERKLELAFLSLVTKLRMYSIETPEIMKLFHAFLGEMESQVRKITLESAGQEDVFKDIKKL